MRSLIKTKSILLFLIINIVSVNSPKNLGYEGQSSKSKIQKEVEDCENEIFTVFSKPTPMDNFLHAFLNINESSLEDETFTELTRGYYYDLSDTLQKMELLNWKTPLQFCTKYYRNEVDNCTHAIEEEGCNANVDGSVCINHLYLHWKIKDEPPSAPVPGTGYLNDEMLSQAFFRGLDSIRDFADLPDHQILEDYYEEIGESPYLSEEDLFEKYHEYLSTHGNSNNVLTMEGYKERFERRQYFDDLLQARRSAYGISNVPYADVCREYYRRQNSPKFYDNYYAMYLHRKIGNCDGEFKSIQQYCETQY